MERLLFLGIALIALSAPIRAEVPAPIGGVEITGAGARFPYPVYAKWFEEYGKIDPSVRFHYQPVGSDGGRDQILARTVDFGASGAALTAAPEGLLYIPVVADAVAIVYNIPGLPKLKLDGATLAAIFLGGITRWNDPRIAGMNSGVELMPTPIMVIHRSDPAASSYLLTDFLNVSSVSWHGQVGEGTSVAWPVGIGAVGNEGVLCQIKLTPGAIGYVELTYYFGNALPCLEMRNAAGVFINPTLESVQAALATTPTSADLPLSTGRASSLVAYPISGTTGLLVYRDQSDFAKAKKLSAFLKWVETQGQEIAHNLNYPPLPDTVRSQGLSRIAEIGN